MKIMWLLFAGLMAAANGISPPYGKIVPGNSDFAFRCYHEISSEAADNNIFFSPLSISTAFAMLSLGAKSTTLSQLHTGLGFNQVPEKEIHSGFRFLLRELNRPDSNLQLNIGNALFTDDKVTLLKKFLHAVQHNYQSEVHPTDFNNSAAAVKKINSYIEEKTDGKLTDVLKDLSPDAVIVLVNYILLKAYWENPFNYEFTREDDFFVDENTIVKVPMMNKNSVFKTYYDEDLSCQIVRLPYKGGVSALFIVPQQGKLNQVEDALQNELVFKWVNSLTDQRIELFIPRFTIFASYDVEKILLGLSITEIFSDQADLSGIAKETKLKVSQAIHEAYLNVHENGTEAAAVTVIEIIPFSLAPKVKFNIPFLVIIYDEATKSILFIARVRNPKA